MASYRTASTQEHQLSKEELAALGFYKKHFGSNRPGNDRTAKVRQLAEAYVAEREKILPKQTAKEIRAAVGRAGSDNPRLGRRYLSLAEAKRRRIDLKRLKSVQNHLYREIGRLESRPETYLSGSVAVRTLDDFGWHLTLLPPDMMGTSTYVPPFGEPWERFVASGADGDGRVLENNSYVEAEFGVLGARLAVENRDAGDFNHIDVTRGNGFLVPYTMPATGILQIEAELICLVCSHHIRTWDEWGWSDIDCTLTTSAVLSVFWGHDDSQPVSETMDRPLAPGLQAHGDGEDSPGTVVQVSAGEPRSVSFYTDYAFPAGKTVWLYAGLTNQIFAALNDVSVESWLDTRWQLASLSVTTL